MRKLINKTNLVKGVASFPRQNKTAYKDEHFKFVYARLATELAEYWQVCSGIPLSKRHVGLFLYFAFVSNPLPF